ncbi:hypothetical protein MJL79_31695, partial [Salmonella enterica subsp. enterica serovar Montevideo]|nr:hypothetical protein [Salmonella enterica subsp. enterica serovar Montevideo]
MNLEGLDRDMAFKLAARGVCTLEDLADQGIDDLADIEDLIRPSVTAMRVIASVNDGFARELKLPPHIRSLGLITADSDD